jgi:hypothetical protein
LARSQRQARGRADLATRWAAGELAFAAKGTVGVQPGQRPQWPLTCHDSHVAQQMVERAAELAGDSHSRTRHAAVLVEEGSLLVWGTNGVPFRGRPLLLQVGELGNHDQCRTHAEQQAITLGPRRR